MQRCTHYETVTRPIGISSVQARSEALKNSLSHTFHEVIIEGYASQIGDRTLLKEKCMFINSIHYQAQ